MSKKLTIFILNILCFGIFMPGITAAQEETTVRDIFFPTDKSARLTQSFGDPRSGHAHEGEDIMGEQMMPLYAAVDGVVKDLVIPEAVWGYAITIEDADGYLYNYLHVNNDTPGTDDGAGGVENAYAPGIREGARVERGRLIGWMGDSGNAEDAGHHLHLEIRQPDDTPINPYPSLVAALERPLEIDYEIAAVQKQSADIAADKDLPTRSEPLCASSSLVKLALSQTVYYCGPDNKRYVFGNDKIYFSWYDDFAEVTEISAEAMAALPLGGNVTYRPGVRLVKIQTDPKVYAVAPGGVLRWVRSEETAAFLYGKDWAAQIDDIPDSFFMDYTAGEAI